MQVDLEVQRVSDSPSVPTNEQFLRWVEAALNTSETCRELTIRIVDESEGQQANRDYRGKDYATNILSFPADLPAGLPAEVKQTYLGDLLLCLPVVTREATAQGKLEGHHWAHLTIHGVLHLQGFDHVEDSEALEMEKLETRILQAMGIPDPYQSLPG